MAGMPGFEPRKCQIQSLVSYPAWLHPNIIWWAEQDLNLQCILRHGFTARLLQPVCISTQNRMVPTTGIEPVTC